MTSVLKIFSVLFFLICCLCSAWAQNNNRLIEDRWLSIDDFGQVSNDELMSRVDRFYEVFDKRDDVVAIVILYGPRTTQYINQRRIEGCSRWRKRSANGFKFIFGPEEHPTKIRGKFLLVEKEFENNVTPPDYKLKDLKKPLELSRAFATDDYCPRYFDLDWFAHFMNANPSFRSEVVIDSTPKEFVHRVTKYRKDIKNLGIVSSRVRFSRKHFVHERDEQWWLIPPKK